MGTMYDRRDFKYLVAGGTILTIHAGFINIVAFTGIWRFVVTHVTGTMTRIASSIVDLNGVEFAFAFMMTFGVTIGAFISGLLNSKTQFVVTPRHAIIVLLESLIIIVSSLILEFLQAEEWTRWVYVFLAIAAGMQNGLCSEFSGAVIRTTHMSGITTDIGLIFGQWVRQRFVRKKKDAAKNLWKLKVLIPLWFGFIVGGILGGVAFKFAGFHALLIPGFTLGISSSLYLLGFGFNIIKVAPRPKSVISGTDPDKRSTVAIVDPEPAKSGFSGSFMRFVQAVKVTHSDDETDLPPNQDSISNINTSVLTPKSEKE